MVSRLDQLRDQLSRVALLIALAVAPLGACRPAGAAADRQGTELEQFRVGLVQPESLSGGAPSRDALVARFVHALEIRDTAALVRLHLSRAEFAWLYYPTNPQSRPPYNLSAGLMWFMETGHSEKGVRRLLEDRAGHSLQFVGYRCDAGVSKQGSNTLTGPCLVRRLDNGNTVDERLFGLIIERGGRYKFVSYANKL